MRFKKLCLYQSCNLVRSPYLITYSLLHGAELDSDDELGFGRHVLEHVCFESPEHVRSQHVVKLFDLVLLGNIGKLLQETFKITAVRDKEHHLCLQIPRGPPEGAKGVH